MDSPGLSAPESTLPQADHLRRVLSCWDLIYYGVITAGLAAPITIFGLALLLSRGQAVPAIMIAMAVTVVTAFSYGRMAACYPSAGSAYTYVARAVNSHLGIAAGWAMLLDYVVMPLFCVVFSALLTQRLLPHVPYLVLTAFFAGGMTVINLLGIRSVARLNRWLLVMTAAVFIVFLVLAIRYLFERGGWGGVFCSLPLYNRATFTGSALVAGTSFSALTFLGFDSVTTLAEDVENPRRNVLVATLAVVIFIGFFSALIVYIGQLVWPDYHSLSDVNTGFLDVTLRVGGRPLFWSFTVLLILSTAASGITAQVAAARLLFGFGRDSVLPARIFAHLKNGNPNLNILICGLAAFFGSMVMNYELASEVLVFGAFIGFAAVNFAAIRQFYVPGRREGKARLFADLLLPALGLLFCAAIPWGLPKPAKIAGSLWFAAGLLYHTMRTRGFRQSPATLPDEELFAGDAAPAAEEVE